MKSVLLSIKPKYCELIASGKKTVEIRKNRPKIDVPFKCYIYQSKGNWIYKILEWLGLYQQKVIGEFVCDRITFLGAITTDKWKYLAGDAHEYHKKMVTEYACLSEAEVLKYGNGKSCYAWHISSLVIYDNPKELSEFHFPSDRYCKKGLCGSCPHDGGADVYGDYDYDCEMKRPIMRPPQSWCYVVSNT